MLNEPLPEPAPTTSATNKEMLTLGVTYAWNWTDAQIKSITQIGSFYAVTNAFYFTAYVAALVGRANVVAAAIAIVGAISALVLLVFLRRAIGHIKLGSNALLELEEILANDLG